MFEQNIKAMKDDQRRIRTDQDQTKKKIAENKEKVKKGMQLPYLVSNIVEIIDPSVEDMEEDGATADLNAGRKDQAAVIKTTTRQVPCILSMIYVDHLPTRHRLLRGQRNPSWRPRRRQQGLFHRL